MKRMSSILFLLVFINLTGTWIYAQEAAKPLYARVLYSKVDAANNDSYLKIIKENVKPALQLAKQEGVIAGWELYSVAYAGSASEYNYVSVLFYDSWAKTESLPNLNDLLKKANPKVNPALTTDKLNEIRKIVRQELASRIDEVAPTPGYKYILVSQMKSTSGDYEKIEREIWKPMHLELKNSGSRAGWGFWQVVEPSGSSTSYNYVTVNVFTDYAQLNAGNFDEAFKKVHPGKDANAVFEQTQKSRDQILNVLLEVVERLPN